MYDSGVLLATALALGFLHGLGADHLMAIAALSIGGAAGSPTLTRDRRAFLMAVRFAAGHGVLLALGASAVLVLGWNIPVMLERAGEIAGGCVLIGLGAIGLWITLSRRVYGHSHAHGVSSHIHWHLHLGRRERHPMPAGHSHLPVVLGALFAVSGLRALTLLVAFGDAHPSLGSLLPLVAIFAVGILCSMSLFGIVLTRALNAADLTARAASLAALFTAFGSIGLGVYWVVVRGG